MQEGSSHLGRTEAFSDGVFAIAATLLILEIKVPSVDQQAPIAELWHGLANLWPSYLAFAIGFGTILIMWVTHHNALHLLTKTSNAFLYANGLLLITVTFVPFPIALLARYIETRYAPVAVVFYAGINLLINGAFFIWFGAMRKPVYLFRPEIGSRQIRRVSRQLWAGILGYVVAAIVGWWLPAIGLGVLVGLEILWIVASIDQRIQA